MKIGFVSLGCPKNLVDSEVMLGLAERAGHTLTADAADADVLVVNTCSFIESARQESIDAILEMAAHKTGGRCRRLVVTGCMAERYRDELRKEIPEIDVVLGTNEVPAIVGALEPLRQPEPRPAPAVPLPVYLYDDRTPRRLTTPSHYAYVKIAEGCNYKCAFCIIPRLRGRYRSRTAASIVREARALAARGVKELLLVSQDTTYFGHDRGERGALARLLRRLNEVDGLEWIRLLYLYPTTVTADTLRAIAECDKVCKYVDLPLQHASNAVLRRMRRPGTRQSYSPTRRRRSVRPSRASRCAPRSSWGSPARRIANSTSFVGSSGRWRSITSACSPTRTRTGPRRGACNDDVPRRVKLARQRALMTLQKRLVAAAGRRRVGDRVRVLVDGPSPEHPLVLRGRTSRPGAGNRLGGVSVGGGPGGVSSGHAAGRRGGGRQGLRPGRPPAVARVRIGRASARPRRSASREGGSVAGREGTVIY